MSSPPRLFLLTATTREAETLRVELERHAIPVEDLDPQLIRGEDGNPMFAGYYAGLLAAPEKAAASEQIDRSVDDLGLNVLKLEMPSTDSVCGRLLRLAEVSDPITGHLLRNILQEHDIVATVTGDTLRGRAPLSQGHTGEIGIYVREEDVAAAHAALENSLSVEPETTKTGGPADIGIEVVAWPQCPNCGERRLAICPICETSGTEFPIADNNFSAGEATPSFACVCTICDEPWSPDFPSPCEWCNYDFATQQVINEAEAEPEPLSGPTDFEPIAINSRVVITVLGMCALLGALALWFMSIAPPR